MKNCCVNCKYEKTCGYSPLAAIGKRSEISYGKCSLGNMSYNRGTFFELREERNKYIEQDYT